MKPKENDTPSRGVRFGPPQIRGRRELRRRTEDFDGVLGAGLVLRPIVDLLHHLDAVARGGEFLRREIVVPGSASTFGTRAAEIARIRSASHTAAVSWALSLSASGSGIPGRHAE